jgi:hypothetical protein
MRPTGSKPSRSTLPGCWRNRAIVPAPAEKHALRVNRSPVGRETLARCRANRSHDGRETRAPGNCPAHGGQRPPTEAQATDGRRWARVPGTSLGRLIRAGGQRGAHGPTESGLNHPGVITACAGVHGARLGTGSRACGATVRLGQREHSVPPPANLLRRRALHLPDQR